MYFMNFLPIIDLHCHLDGAISPEIVRQLADIQKISLPCMSDAELENLISVPGSCESLAEFLKRFSFPCSLMQTEKGIAEAVRLVQEKMKSEGLEYLELRFAPQLHCRNSLSQEAVVKAALDGLCQSSLHTNLILCCMRGENTHSENMETVRLAETYLTEDGGIVALDLAGAEAAFPTADYTAEFAAAREKHIPFTIHAGEAAGAESIRKAVEFGARRIGHGVRLFEDAQLLEEVIRRKIPLEMAPTSNRLTKAVRTMKEYPLAEYLAKGVTVTLNTDDPAVCRTTLAGEFAYIREEFNSTDEQLIQMQLNAVDAAFTSQKTKDWLRQLCIQ